MAFSIPSPRAVLSWTARSAMTAVTTVATGPARVLGLLTAAESVLARADDLLRRTADVVGEAERTVARVRQVTTEAESLLADVGRVTDNATGVVTTAGHTARTADELVTKFRPLAAKFVDELSPHEVDAAISLIDELPKLAGHMTADILPMLATLDRVGPDIHELLEVANDVRQAILGIPGFEYMRRRGEERDVERVAPPGTA